MKFITPVTEDGIVHRYPHNTCFKYNGWPSVCKDDRGILYAVSSSMRMSHVDPTGKNCMWVSFDEGKVWSPTMVVNDSYFDDRDTGITYLGNGKMLLTWFSECYPDFCEPIQGYDWFPAGDKAISKGFGDMWQTLSKEEQRAGHGAFVKTSDNYGMTWSEPIRVPVTAPHGASVCKDGTLVYMGKEMKVDYLAENKIEVYSSHDDGKTWEYTGTVPIPEDNGVNYTNMHEPHVIELPNGRLLGAIRVHGRNVEPSDTVYVTHSDDKGKTWSAPVCIGVYGLPPHLMVHSSGAVICSYCCRVNGKRAERAVVSYDNGETWVEDYMLNDKVCQDFADMGYPASVELSDGTIMTVYYQSLPGDWWTSVLYTKWKLEK